MYDKTRLQIFAATPALYQRYLNLGDSMARHMHAARMDLAVNRLVYGTKMLPTTLLHDANGTQANPHTKAICCWMFECRSARQSWTGLGQGSAPAHVCVLDHGDCMGTASDSVPMHSPWSSCYLVNMQVILGSMQSNCVPTGAAEAPAPLDNGLVCKSRSDVRNVLT
jgi:hypothetical protein